MSRPRICGATAVQTVSNLPGSPFMSASSLPHARTKQRQAMIRTSRTISYVGAVQRFVSYSSNSRAHAVCFAYRSSSSWCGNRWSVRVYLVFAVHASLFLTVYSSVATNGNHHTFLLADHPCSLCFSPPTTLLACSRLLPRACVERLPRRAH